MNKVVTINLNGRAYQLEEAAYDALRAYLDNASATLADDPSKTEIVADLEQAIAEKCDKLLSPHKTVVSVDEIKKIIDEMGPVEGGAKKEGEQNSSSSAQGQQAPKRLFLLRDGAVFTGVCAGLAAYFDIDVTIVRIIFIALTVFTGGIWILLYIAMALLVPYADTAEAMAQAHGEPFNAEALVQRAKERWGESYERVTGSKFDWDGVNGKHEQHLKWKQMRKEQKQQWKHQWKQQTRFNAQYMYRSNPFFGLLRAALAVVWIFAEISLITTGAIFGWAIPAAIPVWLAVIILFVLYHMVTGPMKGGHYAVNVGVPGVGGAGYQYNYSYSEWDGLSDGLTVLFLAIAFGWAYLHVPQVYMFIHHPIVTSQQFIGWLKSL